MKRQDICEIGQAVAETKQPCLASHFISRCILAEGAVEGCRRAQPRKKRSMPFLAVQKHGAMPFVGPYVIISRFKNEITLKMYLAPAYLRLGPMS